MQPVSLLLFLCRAALDGTPLPSGQTLTPEDWGRLYAIAKSHDLAHLLAFGARRLSLSPPPELTEKLERQSMIAVLRTEQLSFELASLSELLSERQIAHLPLKGSVLRLLYPSPEMRTSCDIDLLVRRRDLEAAREAIVSRLGYTDGGISSHDVQMTAPSGVHLELHFDLIEDGFLPAAARLLENIWEYASPKEGCCYALTDEMFYFYHIAHMAKHFVNGGCGIRPFLDLAVLETAGALGEDSERARLLSLGGMTEFDAAARELTALWFGKGEPTDAIERFAEVVLTGGVYGNADNRAVIGQSRRGGKLAYVLSRLFPPFKTLKRGYPVLNRHPYLAPLVYLWRFIRPIFRGRTAALLREARVTGSLSREQGDETSRLLDSLGLLTSAANPTAKEE